MFTGIIQDIGVVTGVRRVGGDLRLTVSINVLSAENIAVGDSVSVSGACLTVVARAASALDFDVSLESLGATNIGVWSEGTRVNLELALLPTTRLGGHLVSGHVDGVGSLLSVTESARSRRLDFEVPADLARYIAPKGSIAVDGVSLTVNETAGDRFSVNIIPHTWETTTLGDRAAGDTVQLEVDQIARYLEQLVQSADNPLGSDLPEEGAAGAQLSGNGPVT